MRAVVLLFATGCGFSIDAGATIGSDATGDAASDQAIDQAAADAPVPDAAQCVGYASAYGQSRYRVATEQSKLDFDAAMEECASDGGRLAIIESLGEHDHIAQLVRGFSDWSWIGLTDRASEGNRVWITGAPLLPTDFQVFNSEIGDPAADCYNLSPSMIGADSARWGNYFCDAPKGWICECI